MNLPQTLKIGGFVWQVKVSAEITYEGSCYGSTHWETLTIYLRPSLHPQKQAETLLHEVLHIVLWQSGLHHRYQHDDKPDEEQVVQAMSPLLFQVLSENPPFGEVS